MASFKFVLLQAERALSKHWLTHNLSFSEGDESSPIKTFYELRNRPEKKHHRLPRGTGPLRGFKLRATSANTSVQIYDAREGRRRLRAGLSFCSRASIVLHHLLLRWTFAHIYSY
jgi:hypothetical protein